MELADWPRTEKTCKIDQEIIFFGIFLIILFPDSSCLFLPIFTVVAYGELVLIVAHERLFMAAILDV